MIKLQMGNYLKGGKSFYAMFRNDKDKAAFEKAFGLKPYANSEVIY